MPGTQTPRAAAPPLWEASGAHHAGSVPGPGAGGANTGSRAAWSSAARGLGPLRPRVPVPAGVAPVKAAAAF